MTPYAGLPGAEWILRGVADLIRGQLSPEALCVARRGESPARS
jgi:hypothetical protein